MLVRCSTDAAVAITTAHTSLKTILQVAMASGRQGRLLAWGVSGYGVDAAAFPQDVHLLRQTDAGTTPGGDGLEVVWDGEDGGTISAVAKQGIYSAEPSSGAILDRVWVPTRGAGIRVYFAPGREIIIPAAGRIAIATISNASSETWNAQAWMLIDE